MDKMNKIYQQLEINMPGVSKQKDTSQNSNQNVQQDKEDNVDENNQLKRKNPQSDEYQDQPLPKKQIKTEGDPIDEKSFKQQINQFINNLNQQKQNTNDDDNSRLDVNEQKIQKTQDGDEQDGIIKFAKEDDKNETQEVLSEKKIAPWVRSKTLRIQNPILRFHNEIIEFCSYLEPTEEEHEIRTQSFNNLTKLIKDVLPDCEVKSFGSFTTQLYLPNADIDLVIVNENASNQNMYKNIAKMLTQRTDLYESINLITNAKVPIIKFVESKTQINFDISFNKLDGVKQLQEVQKTLKIYPEMKYLIFVLKCMIRQRDLHETFRGGIGSFLLFCMILAFLREVRRQYHEENKVHELNSISLGEYILKFFEFYGIKNDWNRKRIIMQQGGAIIDKIPPDNTFSLISPQDSDHDIGSSSFKIRDVFNVFKNRYHFMTNFNFRQGESVLKYLVNPSGGKFIFTKEELEK